MSEPSGKNAKGVKNHAAAGKPLVQTVQIVQGNITFYELDDR